MFRNLRTDPCSDSIPFRSLQGCQILKPFDIINRVLQICKVLSDFGLPTWPANSSPELIERLRPLVEILLQIMQLRIELVDQVPSIFLFFLGEVCSHQRIDGLQPCEYSSKTCNMIRQSVSFFGPMSNILKILHCLDSNSKKGDDVASRCHCGL